MDKIRILLDRHFPYDTAWLKGSKFSIRKISPPVSLPSSAAGLFHVLELYYHSFKADIILGNRRTSLLLGLLYHIYKPKSVSLLGYEIIFNFKKGWKHKLVKLIWRLAIRKIDQLVVMSESEKAYLAQVFHTSPARFSTINFYAENAPYLGPTPGGYLFSAGRMERDFETFIQALKGTGYPAVIVADASHKEKLESIRPSNVTIYYNIPKDKYIDLLKGSGMVVVPLLEGAASRGQVVILEAMKFGKPLICSKVAGTVDYLTNGKEGFFVAPQNPDALRATLNRCFTDMPLLKEMGKKAFETQQKRFSPQIFYSRYQELMLRLYQEKKKVFRGSIAAASRPKIAKASRQ